MLSNIFENVSKLYLKNGFDDESVSPIPTPSRNITRVECNLLNSLSSNSLNYKYYHLDSTITVTGPSLIIVTSIIAPNIPSLTLSFPSKYFSLVENILYNLSAFSGLAALLKLGLLPLRVSP